MRFKKIVPIAFLVCLAFVVVDAGCSKEVEAGPAAPDFSLVDLGGNPVSLKDFRGSVVLLDFWATWCPPCRMSIPELIGLQRTLGDKGLVILGVSVDDSGQAPDHYLEAFKKDNGINYRIARYSREIMTDYFGKERVSIPTMFVIDRKGTIKSKLVGFEPGAVEKAVKRVL